MPYIRGYEEDGFLKQLKITRQTLEILTPDKVSFLQFFLVFILFFSIFLCLLVHLQSFIFFQIIPPHLLFLQCIFCLISVHFFYFSMALFNPCTIFYRFWSGTRALQKLYSNLSKGSQKMTT